MAGEIVAAELEGRCPKCNRLLIRGQMVGTVEMSCPKCGALVVFGSGLLEKERR